MGRRLVAEFTGTGPLVAVVVGSGTAAPRLTTDGALRLLVNSAATALGLAVLIGRTLTSTYAGIAAASAPAFIAAQLLGGAIGTLLAVITHPVPSRTVRADQSARLAG